MATVVHDVFRALADPTRRDVVARLAQGPAAVTDLAAPFDMALPSFVQHLRVLEDGGVVQSAKSGRVRTFRLVPSGLAVAEGWLSEQRDVWEQRSDRFAHYVDELQRSRP